MSRTSSELKLRLIQEVTTQRELFKSSQWVVIQLILNMGTNGGTTPRQLLDQLGYKEGTMFGYIQTLYKLQIIEWPTKDQAIVLRRDKLYKLLGMSPLLGKAFTPPKSMDIF